MTHFDGDTPLEQSETDMVWFQAGITDLETDYGENAMTLTRTGPLPPHIFLSRPLFS